ncbi:hypothetical protein SLH49_02540 [Cognatiyoonia sp. IB215446]|uniref:hypothetical protein n=1 Tax=Cognatiyoonia sp. IB215446 TaxID=3097355 RepID=UPI002A0B327A|nr:hypothetical protein [Cognatiyoonia sp. IB215446]MDX8346854.1 hypothetical protein [Cognatiyoonia sp. IB215446]
MIVYSHRFSGIIQQMVVDLGLDMILSDQTSPVSLIDNETMLNDVANGLGVDMKKVVAADGSVLFKFQRRN